MLYVILVGAVVVFWLVAIDRPILSVKFVSGKLDKVKGHLSPSFKHNLKEIIEREEVTGTLKVYQTRNNMKLKFSSSVPKSCQQKIRNIFPHQSIKPKGKKRKG
ncbi:DUF3634 family protein [Vibrio sp. ZSDZ34]|jgi:hypothetical protein|uniref:DUF3634 family protein n=1 Tax=Vibrio gelatinilyticus TaxID=2893468 RepID=A0A9X1WAA7_9VIBR|nr:DUF3634 family protein [Vibrio gelatinilyticus]MCJ2376606.1 DUF3634 family protein [Vibrio gelatinilyticus]